MWVLVGAALLVGACALFWEDIRNWLTNSAANAVQKALGYSARQTMLKAICAVDRVVNKLRTLATIYCKKNPLDTRIERVKLGATAPTYDTEKEVLQRIEKEGQWINEFQFKM